MKKFLSLLLIMAFGSVTFMSAQCAKSAAKKSCTAKEKAACMADAKAAADANDAIEIRTSDDGHVAYFEKSVCAVSGNTSYQEVEWCNKSKAFKPTAVASASAEKMDMDHSAVPAKKCCKGAAASGKKCCSSKSASKKTCGSKAKASKAQLKAAE